ncbi:hypothetical protein ABIE64_000365 [Thalassospira sp. MBR-102]
MAFPCARDAPLATPPPPCHRVRSLPCHRLIPVLPPETQKTRKSESRFAGFVSGPICPVDFIFMPQHKEQIKNYLPENRKKFPIKAQYSEKTIFINALGMIILFPRQSPHRKRSPNRAPFVVVYPGQSAAQFGNLVSRFLCQAGDGGPVTGLDRVLGGHP